MTRLEQLKKLLDADSGDIFIKYALAKEMESLGDVTNALKQYRDLLEKDPTYVGAYYHLGKLYESLHEPQEAMQVYQKGIAMCRLQGDSHALSELMNAKNNLEMENL